MSRGGSGVPWWRVVNAAGSPPAHHARAALEHLRAEGTPLSADGTRVALRRAIWFPDD
jgi:alkylated DNA nucleotide flippase Atl1